MVNATKEDYTEKRILFLIETAHWYYIDYFQKKDPSLRTWNYQAFAKKIFHDYPPLTPFKNKFQGMWDEMKSYKRQIPVCGGVILNKEMNRVLLVRGPKNNDGFSFPRGKINNQETKLACAAREIYEETGLSVERLLEEKDFVFQDARAKANNGQFVTLFFVSIEEAGLVTKPNVLNEIGSIQWHSIHKLIKEGSRNYLLPYFLPLIETWVKRRNPSYTPAAQHGRVVYDARNPDAAFEEPKPTEPSTMNAFYFDRNRLASCFGSATE